MPRPGRRARRRAVRLRPEVFYFPDGSRAVEVPTEDGRRTAIWFLRDPEGAYWVVRISDDLVRLAPEAIAAALAMAVLEMRAEGVAP